jgi:prepilin-type N-terminal cleavage/methylation domain-containing protein
MKSRTVKGFSLVEVVTALGIFSMIMLGVVLIMGTCTKSYRSQRLIQSNLEAAQFALNTMAKELRTSSVVASSVGGTVSTITFFDYSQNRCIQYRADEGSSTLSKRSRIFSNANPNTNRTDCNNYTWPSETYASLVSGLSDQNLSVIQSSATPPLRVGRVTVSLTLGTTTGKAAIQTTVSLRDFNYVGI